MLLTNVTPPSILNKLPAPPVATIVPVGILQVGWVVTKLTTVGAAFTVTVIKDLSLSTPFNICET